MILTNEQIKAIAFGFVYTEESEKGVRFYKCTKKQIDAWSSLSDFLGSGSRCTTGIRLDFHTSSKTLTLEAEGRFELHIDGLYSQTLIFDEGKKRTTVSLKKECVSDDARVTLIFPSHSAGLLTSVELDDGASVTPHVFDKRLLFIGDSITQGWDSGYDSLSYAWRTTSFFNAESVIHGVGGGYFDKDVFDSIDFVPDAVIVAFGTNDFAYRGSIDEMISHAHGFLSLLSTEYKDKKLFYISPIWRSAQAMAMGSFDDCRKALIKEAEDCGFTHIDGITLVPHSSEFYADEILHPSALGFGIYAENLIKILVKHL